MSELTPERERFIRHKVCQHELLSQSCNEELLAEIDRLRAALAARDDLLKQTVTDQCDDESALEKLLTDRGFARQSNSDLVEPLVDFVERVLAARDDELRRLREAVVTAIEAESNSSDDAYSPFFAREHYGAAMAYRHVLALLPAKGTT